MAKPFALLGTILLKDVYDIPTGVEFDEISTNKLSTFPNPFHSEIRIQGLDGPANYTILDLSGKTVQTGSTDGWIKSDLEAGMYNLILSTGNKNQIIKLVKVD